MAEALALCSGSFPTDRLALFFRDFQKLLVVVVSFHSFSPREEEDEEHEEHEELGDFQLVTDDNAFDSEEVRNDKAKQNGVAFWLRTQLIYLIFEYIHQCKIHCHPEQVNEKNWEQLRPLKMPT